MIILTSPTDQNQQAAKSLASFYHVQDTLELSNLMDLNNIKDKFCFIIDLDKNNYINEILSPQAFAQQLIENGLPETVDDIYLLSNENLTVFAHQFSKAFSQFHTRQINIHIASHINYLSTTIIPPHENNKNWEIIGDDESLWKGKNILEWLDDPQHTFNDTIYVWSGA